MRKNSIFLYIYLGFVLLMITLIMVVGVYMDGLLTEYESRQPEHQAQAAMEQLVADSASADAFWEKYSLPKLSDSQYETADSVKSKYLSLYGGDELKYSVKNGTYPEDELHYLVRNGNNELAEVVLKAAGPVETRLLVFSSREWSIQSVNPILEQKQYSLQLPDDFSVLVNGVVLPDDSATPAENGTVKYSITGLYLEPTFAIKNENGEDVGYVVKNDRVIPEYYDYTLALPHTLQVTVNGTISEGVAQPNGTLLHEIRFLEKPEVQITDLFGNTVVYEGGDLDVTFKTIVAPDSYSVTCDGKDIPSAAKEAGLVPAYEIISDLVTGLPTQVEYNISILKADAEIKVLDDKGSEVTLEEGKQEHDLMSMLYSDTVPAEISDVIDVLDIAQKWSLYMSNDVSFANMSKLMLQGSKQYEEARKYANSIDRTFFSNHTLHDPAFTECNVKNFIRITEDCFSVEVSFIKHMRLTRTGKDVDDPMNDRFYFVRKDGKWLLAALKEVVTDGE